MSRILSDSQLAQFSEWVTNRIGLNFPCEESSVIHGMPGEAINLGATMYVLSPNQISAALGSLVK